MSRTVNAYVSAVTIDADKDWDWIDLTGVESLSFSITTSAGTAVGTVQVDLTNFDDKSGSQPAFLRLDDGTTGTTVAIASGANAHGISLSNPGMRWGRLSFDSTSGTSALSASYHVEHRKVQ